MAIGGCDGVRRTDDPSGLPESTMSVVEVGDGNPVDVGEGRGILLPTGRGSLDATPTPSPIPIPPTPAPSTTPRLHDAGEPPVPEPKPTPTPTPERATEPAAGARVDATLTFYVCSGSPPGFQEGYCGITASGQPVYEGGAACGYAMPLGATFTIEGDPTGRTYTCIDRGLGPHWWVDIFFWTYAEGRAWRDQLPQYVTVEMTP